MLRREIDAGVVTAGQRLLEVEVAARFDVSRTPVREALIRLAREGVLERAERGFAVPRDDLASLHERMEARRLLDVEIARRAALAAAGTSARTTALHDQLRRAAAAHAANRARDFATAHYELREGVRRLAGNRLLARCAALIDDSFRVGRERLYRLAENRAMTLDADQRLVQAIEQGDGDAAAAITSAFLTDVARVGAAAMAAANLG